MRRWLDVWYLRFQCGLRLPPVVGSRGQGRELAVRYLSLCYVFVFKDVSRELNFGSILIFASCVVGTCNVSFWELDCLIFGISWHYTCMGELCTCLANL